MHLHGLSYVSEIIRIKLATKKTRKFVAKKYYGDLQLLPMPTHCWKDTSYDLIFVIINRLTGWENLSIDFATGCPLERPQLRFDLCCRRST